MESFGVCCVLKNLRSTGAGLLIISIFLVIGLCLWTGQVETSRESTAAAIFSRLGLESNADYAQREKRENEFREDQLNKLRMLKKRFDSLESTVAKIDILERSLQRVELVVEGLVNLSSNFPRVAQMTTVVIDPSQNIVPNLAVPMQTAGNKCHLKEVEGSWSPSWKWANSGCNIELEEHDIDGCLSQFRKTAFLGDSQMYHMFRTLIRGLTSRTCSEIKSGGRCGQVASYLGLKAADPAKLVRPNPELLEGPRTYGKEHPGCTDCAGCDLGLVNCSRSTSTDMLLEYMPVEFAKDVELQSSEANTTQENVVLYLSRSSIPPSLVLLNVGLHDSMVLELRHDGTDEMDPVNIMRTRALYRQNLGWFAGLLRKHLPAAQVVFITTTPKNMKYFKGNYTNPLIESMNKDAREVVQSYGYWAVDVFPLLNSDQGRLLFSDEVHAHEQGGAYYKTVRDLVARRVCGP